MKKIITMALLMCLGYVVAQATTYKYSGRVGFDQIDEILDSSSAWRIAPRGKLYRSRISVLVGKHIMDVYADTCSGSLFLVASGKVYSLTGKAETFLLGYMLKLYPEWLTSKNSDVHYREYGVRPWNLPQIKIKLK